MIIEVSRISIEEQDQVEHGPNLLVAPVFAHDICWVVLSIQESKVDELGSNDLTYTVEGQCIVPLV